MNFQTSKLTLTSEAVNFKLSSSLSLSFMEELLKQIETYKDEINLFAAPDQDTLEAFRIKYLGTKGLVKNVMGEMKNVPNENKKAIWPAFK